LDNKRVIELPKSGPVRWLVLILIFFVGACCVVVFMLPFALDDAQYLNKSIQLGRDGIVVQGIVSEIEASEDEDAVIVGIPDTYYRLTVEYVVDGQTYTVRNQKFIKGYGVGDTVDVIYDPADPTVSQVDFFDERWLDPFLELLPF
jgi:hypothetical protein